MEPQSSFSFAGSQSVPQTSQQPSSSFAGVPSSFGGQLPQQPGPAAFGAFGSSAPNTSTFPASNMPPTSAGLFSSAGSQPGPSLFSGPPHSSVFPSSALTPTPVPTLTPLPDGARSVPYPADVDRPSSDSLVTGFEVEGETADLLLTAAGKRYKVCSRLLSTRSELVRKAVEGKERSLEVELPLSSDVSTFLLWLHTLNTTALLDAMKSFDIQVDLLALGVYFQVSSELHFDAKVLCLTSPATFSFQAAMPPCWDRGFIPLHLAMRVISLYRSVSRSPFLGNVHHCTTQMALEWLGERRCFSSTEVEALRNSEEFQCMKRVLQENYCLPASLQEYLALAKRYPVAIDVFTIGDMFRSLNLI